MFKQTDKNSFFGNYLYERIVPKDNFLRQLSASVDFSFINALCLNKYDHFGQAGNRPYEPELLFKILFLSFCYDISLREVEEQINDRLSFKLFLGLAVDEAAPDHSTLTVFRDRFKEETFQEIFNHIVEQAKAKELVHDRLKIIDSTDIRANVDLARLIRKKEDKEKKNDGSNDSPDNYIDKTSPDSDARFGRKSSQKQFYGYKGHIIIDGDSEIIENIVTTPGNIKDEQIVEPLLEKIRIYEDLRRKTKIIADKGYDTNSNHELIENHKCQSFIIIKRNRTVAKLKKRLKTKIYRATIKERYKVERRFADGKSNHGLGKCRWLGIWKVKIQNYLIATVLNCKRIVTLLSPPPNLAGILDLNEH